MGSARQRELALAAGCVSFGVISLVGQLLFAEVTPVRPLPPFKPAIPMAASVPAAAVASLAPVPRPAAPAAPVVADTLPASGSAPAPRTMNLSRLVEALVEIESAGDHMRVGNHGERGLMQLKASTWAGVTERLYGRPVSFHRAFEPGMNRSMGLAYLEELRDFLAAHRDEWRSDERSLLLACYNCGPTRVQAGGFDFSSLPLRTQDYVRRATALCDAM